VFPSQLVRLNQHLLVIAAHHVEPFFIEQREALYALRSAVNNISNGKQAVSFGIKTDFAQLFFQKLVTSMNIAHRKIAAFFIGFYKFVDCGCLI